MISSFGRRPLLVLVIPANPVEKQWRGQLFGEWLKNCSRETACYAAGRLQLPDGRGWLIWKDQGDEATVLFQDFKVGVTLSQEAIFRLKANRGLQVG